MIDASFRVPGSGFRVLRLGGGHAQLSATSGSERDDPTPERNPEPGTRNSERVAR
jgi:hypothetical protein